MINLSENPQIMNMLKKKKMDFVHTEKIYTRKDGRIFTKIE